MQIKSYMWALAWAIFFGGMILSIFGIISFEYKKNEVIDILKIPESTIEPTLFALPKELSIDLYINFDCEVCSSFYTDTITPLQKKYYPYLHINIIPFTDFTNPLSVEKSSLYQCQKNKNDIFNLSPEMSPEITTCINDPQTIITLHQYREDAIKSGVKGTPTIFFDDNQKQEGKISLENLDLEIIKRLKN